MLNSRPRILIVDDDEGFCKFVAKHLERANFEVTSAHSAEEGLPSALNGSFDAIVLDHMLPEHDGLIFLNSMAGSECAPPIVYLTANQDSRVAVAALKAGAADHVIKDVHGDFLILLENAVTNAMLAAAIRRDKEKAEAEIRAARDQFKALADERALLLREVNHRVSNSLQLIASLLHFQGDLSGNADVKAALKEAIGRVLAVARVHRSLYASFDARWISLAGYLSSLIRDLKDVSAGGKCEESAIAFASDPIQAGPDTAVAVGIVTAELVLNALKHAYPDGRGPVRVSLRAVDSNVELAVEDDGVGGMDEIPQAGRRGLGHRIISGMSEKLYGCIHYQARHPGTRASLTFPLGDDVRVLPDRPETASGPLSTSASGG
ncbi:MAG: sensor histidine kinase [Rhodomicrobium sp.]